MNSDKKSVYQTKLITLIIVAGTGGATAAVFSIVVAQFDWSIYFDSAVPVCLAVVLGITMGKAWEKGLSNLEKSDFIGIFCAAVGAAVGLLMVYAV